jgi:NTP pyrophosphatase (non-canonical NTP hydrolase)
MTARIDSEIHRTIDAEFANAYAKHVGKTPRSHSVGDQQSLVILVEEVGEVARAMTYDEGDQQKLYDELIQVATMAAAWAERVGIRGDA